MFKCPALLRHGDESHAYARDIIQCTYIRKFSVKNYFFIKFGHVPSLREGESETAQSQPDSLLSVDLHVARGGTRCVLLSFTLNTYIYSMTYKRKMAKTRLSNLRRSRGGRHSSQDSVNEEDIELQVSVAGAGMRGNPSAPPPPPSPELCSSLASPPNRSFSAAPQSYVKISCQSDDTKDETRENARKIFRS